LKLPRVTRRRVSLGLAEGDEVDVLVEEEGGGHPCRATVAKVENDRFWLDVADSRRLLPPLAKGASISVRFTREDGVHLIKAKILRQVGEGGTTLELRCKARTVSRHQRREYFRVKEGVSLKFSLDRKKSRSGLMTVTSKDISGGGVLLELPTGKVNVGESVGIRIFLPGQDSPIQVKGLVKRVARECGREGANTEVGIEFTSIEEDAREAIISYLFRVERGRLGAVRKPGKGRERR